MRPIVATISPVAFAQNLTRVRSLVGARVAIHAVVKANAYGHGVANIVPAAGGAEGLAVIELEKAIECRDALRWQKEIVVLEGFYATSELIKFSAHRISAVVHCQEQIEMLASTALPVPLNVYLKFNSGMNRLGFPIRDAKAIFAKLRALPNVAEIVLTTHFARADEPGGFATQLATFNAATRGIVARRSLSNSGASAQFAQVGGDIVRPGIMLYGGTPIEGTTAASHGLLPTMALDSKIIAIQNVSAGQSVGYGGTNVAPSAMRIAVVAGGYADGYPRAAKNGTPVAVAGVRAPLFGRVSMDKITVDVSHLPNATVGAPVQLWGGHIPVDEVASHAGTISYALLTALNSRVPVQTIETLLSSS